MNSVVEQLNRRLGEALGTVRGGSEPRFCWKWAPDLPLWRNRLGAVWVLCQWQKPGLSREEWHRQFGGRFPYPVNGTHHAHPETALPPGRMPDEWMTQRYIRTLDEQMSTSFVTHLCNVENEIAEQKDRDYEEWVERVQDSNPAFSNFDSGQRGGHVSYGGN